MLLQRRGNAFSGSFPWRRFNGGVDATKKVVQRAERLSQEEGLADRIRFVLADVCDSGLPEAEADFVWGEDAWCYVADKAKLIAEAARIVKPGGTIAFTDWVEGPGGLSDAEAERFMGFMKFATLQDIEGYRRLLEDNGCEVLEAEDTGRFARYLDLYQEVSQAQLTYDALKIVGFDLGTMASMAQEFAFFGELAHAGKIAQGRFIARRK